MKKQQGNIITIKEDVRIPGTDMILEAGDRIQVGSNAKKSRRRTEAFQAVNISGGLSSYDDGYKLANEIVDYLMSTANDDVIDGFLESLEAEGWVTQN
jgi:hypothetical protein